MTNETFLRAKCTRVIKFRNKFKFNQQKERITSFFNTSKNCGVAREGGRDGGRKEEHAEGGEEAESGCRRLGEGGEWGREKGEGRREAKRRARGVKNKRMSERGNNNEEREMLL